MSQLQPPTTLHPFLIACHALLQDPAKYLEPLISAGASSISFQIEPFMAQNIGQPGAAVAAAAEVADRIRAAGLKAALALGVETQLLPELVDFVGEGKVDMVSRNLMHVPCCQCATGALSSMLFVCAVPVCHECALCMCRASLS